MGRKSDAKERLIEAMRELIWLGSYGTTSVDDICTRAGVKKGSFYHFFTSKTELALATLEQGSNEVFLEFESIYATTVPPLERLQNEARWGLAYQKNIKKKYGRVLGCPLFSLGAEVGTREKEIVQKVAEILDKHLTYYEAALRDAQNLNLIEKTSIKPLARRMLAYAEGMLTQARIHNDISYIAEIESGFMSIIGVKI